MISTYEKIVALCKKKGIAVTVLERELGFGRGSIGKMKNGNKPSVDRLEKIANYFSVPITYFTGDDSKSTVTNRYDLNGVYASFAKEAQDEGIDPEDIRNAIDLIKSLRSK